MTIVFLTKVTIKDLNNYIHIKIKLRYHEEKLIAIRTMAERMTKEITGMPRGGIAKDYIPEILEQEKIVKRIRKKCHKEYIRLVRYIESVEDIHIQNIMNYRFVEGYSWRKTARKIGGRNTEDSVKKLIYRFLDEQ